MKVRDKYVQALGEIEPLHEEEWQHINYPKPSSIPEKRGGYAYYTCQINGTDAVVRRARKKPLKGVLEVLAPHHLRLHLGISDGEKVTIAVAGEPLPPTKVVYPESRVSYTRDAPDDHQLETTRLKAFKKHGLQNMDFYKTAAGTTYPIQGMYKGASAFLIMNGPSMATMEGKERLNRVFTMCVNNGVKGCMPHFRPNAWACVDSADSFLHTIWEDPTIIKFCPNGKADHPLWNNDLKKPLGKAVKHCPNVVYFNRNNEWDASRFWLETTANWGNNGKIKDQLGFKGKRSVMLVALRHLQMLGFTSIYILGADFKMDQEQGYSFEQSRNKGAVSNNNKTYNCLNARFAAMLPYAHGIGLEIYNCTPDSGLTAFPFMEFDKALGKALQYTGNAARYLAGSWEDPTELYNTKWYVCKCKKDVRLASDIVKRGEGWTCPDCGHLIDKGNYKKHRKKRRWEDDQCSDRH